MSAAIKIVEALVACDCCVQGVDLETDQTCAVCGGSGWIEEFGTVDAEDVER